MAVGFAGPVVAAGLMVRRRWAHVPGRTSLWRASRSSISRNWRFALNQVAVYAALTVELWVAGLVFDAVDASHYSAAQRVSLLLMIPMTAMQVVFAPVAARMLDRGRTADLQAVLRTGATAAAVITSFVWVPLLAPGSCCRWCSVSRSGRPPLRSWSSPWVGSPTWWSASQARR